MPFQPKLVLEENTKIKIMYEIVLKNKICFKGNHCYITQCSLHKGSLSMYNVFAFRKQYNRIQIPCCGWLSNASTHVGSAVWSERLSATWALAITTWCWGGGSLNTGHYHLIVEVLFFTLHLTCVWEGTEVSCYFSLYNELGICQAYFLAVVSSRIWKPHDHFSYTKPPQRKVCCYNLDPLTCQEWIAFWKTPGLSDHQLFGKNTMMINMIVVRKWAKWICNMSLDLNFEYCLNGWKFIILWPYFPRDPDYHSLDQYYLREFSRKMEMASVLSEGRHQPRVAMGYAEVLEQVRNWIFKFNFN